ncbi:MAG: hypothetical protein N2491_11730 [Negativicutes bacterium]|nr:hypothetical protein [Negativicutes bacterium]
MKEAKPVHELCVDKSSCKGELANKQLSSAADLTKDNRKQYEAAQQKPKSTPR